MRPAPTLSVRAFGPVVPLAVTAAVVVVPVPVAVAVAAAVGGGFRNYKQCG